MKDSRTHNSDFGRGVGHDFDDGDDRANGADDDADDDDDRAGDRGFDRDIGRDIDIDCDDDADDDDDRAGDRGFDRDIGRDFDDGDDRANGAGDGGRVGVGGDVGAGLGSGCDVDYGLGNGRAVGHDGDNDSATEAWMLIRFTIPGEPVAWARPRVGWRQAREDGLTLPKPYYRDDSCTIYCGDCREIVPGLGRFDLLLTDPPYGLGDRWTGGGSWQHHAGLYAQAKKWDQETATAEQIMALAECASVAIVWGGNYFGLPPSRGWLAWVKPQRMHTVADFELAWTNIDFPAKAFGALRNPDGRREHPTQKPLTLMSWCIGQADRANAGDVQTILDPFMGSGTTLRAAKDLGRKAIGIEIEERYCEIAVRRLAQEVLL